MIMTTLKQTLGHVVCALLILLCSNLSVLQASVVASEGDSRGWASTVLNEVLNAYGPLLQ
jgi:hypothetical protein